MKCFDLNPLLFLIVFNVVYMPKFSHGTCPDYVTIGPRTAQPEDKSMCAIVYRDRQCGGAYDEIYIGERQTDMPREWNNEITSLVVREGCVYTGYEHDGCDDGHDHKEFIEVHADLNDEPIHITDWSNAISSFHCECVYNAVDCEPTDEWAQVAFCSNSAGADDITCKYHQDHGYTIGNSITNGQSMETNIGLNVMGEIAMLFELRGDASFSTGYSWETSTEFSQSYEEGIEIDFIVEPGEIKAVYQVQGKCGDTIIKAPCFDTRDEKTGKSIKTDCPIPPTRK